MTRSIALPWMSVEAENAGRPREPAAVGPTEASPRTLVGAALEGNAEAMHRLVVTLRPAIQAEVAWTLERLSPHGQRRDARQETADLVQEIFLALLENDGRILRAWNPDRGRSLTSFCRLVARHQVVSILRSRRRCPWTEDPTPLESMTLAAVPSPESRVTDADAARRLIAVMRQQLSTRSMLMFEGLFVEERTVEEVCTEFGLSKDALYAWRSRLRRKIAGLARRMGLGGDAK